jgi:hypothetical protein
MPKKKDDDGQIALINDKKRDFEIFISKVENEELEMLWSVISSIRKNELLMSISQEVMYRNK